MALLTGLVLFMASCSNFQDREIKIFHYNIKELDSLKIREIDRQVQAVKNVIAAHQDANVLSINEMQFDLPNVPTSEFQSSGQNMKLLIDALDLPGTWFDFFAQGNTGNLAGRKANGDYFLRPNEANSFQEADKINFGIFPGQYSTAAATQYPIIDTFENATLRWKEFRQDLDLSAFSYEDFEKIQDVNGVRYESVRRSFDEESMELFDKNFTDLSVLVDGELVHLIFFHTVPAFNFGNEEGLNVERNADQLRFLEWYLTGETDIEVPDSISILPLEPNARFIAIGDWNVDINDSSKEGAMVLRRLFQKFNSAHDFALYSYESQDFNPQPFFSRFDYIMYSSHFELSDSGIVHPEANRVELGCQSTPRDIPENPLSPRVITEYKVTNLQNDQIQFCYAEVDRAYYEMKLASDHLALWAKLRLKGAP